MTTLLDDLLFSKFSVNNTQIEWLGAIYSFTSHNEYDPQDAKIELRDKTAHHLYTISLTYAETEHVILHSNLKRRVSRKLPALRDQDPGKYPGLVLEPAAQIWGPATNPNLFYPISPSRRSCRGFESAFYRAGNAYLAARKHVSSNRGRWGTRCGRPQTARCRQSRRIDAC